MNSPAYLVSKITQRVNYNIGKVFKEAGLGRLILPLNFFNSYGQIRFSYVK
jgi:hypothetical protein